MPTLISSPPRIKINGSPVSAGLADRILALEVVLSTQRPGRATLRLQDDEYTLLDGDDVKSLTIGQNLVVALAEGEASATEVFEGDIVSLGIERSESGANSVVVVEARDGSHRLQAAAHPTTWLDATTKDIVQAVAGRHGLAPKISGAAASKQEHPYLVQSGTDHALVDALARQIGFEWWTHGRELHFTERPSTPGVTVRRDELVELSVRYDGQLTPKTVKVTSWDPVNSEAIVGTSEVKKEAEALGSKATFVTSQHKAAKDAFGADLSVGEAVAVSQEQAKAMAEALEQDLLGDGLHLEGTVAGYPAIRPGTWLELLHLGASLDGDYYLTEVRHSFGPGQDLMTTFVSAPRRPEAADWRPALHTPGSGAWALRGVVPGVVTNVDDDQGLGRVKVKFPSLGDDIESTWARVVAPGAGADRGLDLRPRVDDEVVVAFAHGDQAQPFVLGGVWSAKHAHADGAEGVVDGTSKRDALRSEDGALLTFHREGEGTGDAGHKHPADWDTDLKGAVSLRSAAESGVIIGDKIVMSTPGKDIVITNGEATITLAENGDVTIKGGAITFEGSKKLTAKLQQDVTVEAGTKMTLKAMSATIDCPAKTEVKSPGGIKLQSVNVEMGP